MVLLICDFDLISIMDSLLANFFCKKRLYGSNFRSLASCNLFYLYVYICVCVDMDLIINFFDIDSTNIDLIYEGW